MEAMQHKIRDRIAKLEESTPAFSQAVALKCRRLARARRGLQNIEHALDVKFFRERYGS